MATINGTAGADTLTGTSSADTINGGDGADILQGYEGNDTLNGDAGSDRLIGDRGADLMYGGGGNDTFFVSYYLDVEAGERYSGGAGYDRLEASLNIDFSAATIDADVEELTGISAGVTRNQLLQFSKVSTYAVWVTTGGTIDLTGHDFYAGGITLMASTVLTLPTHTAMGYQVDGSSANDDVTGTAFHDDISGGAGADVLRGAGGDDYLEDIAGSANTLDGGAGHDTLVLDITGPVAANVLTGGDGNDSFRVQGDIFQNMDALTVDGGEGYDKLQVNGAFDLTNATLSGIEEVTTSSYVKLTTTQLAGIVVFDGYLDIAGSGAITFNAAMTDLPEHIRLLEAGATLDLSGLGDSNQPVEVTGSSGVDTVLGSLGGDTLIGLGGADVLSGGDGNDVIVGGAGADQLDGGDGDDRFDVFDGDVAAGEHYVGGGGYDTIAVAIEEGVVFDATHESVEYLDASGGSLHVAATALEGLAAVSAHQLTIHGSGAVDLTGAGVLVETLFLANPGMSLTLTGTSTNVMGSDGADTLMGDIRYAEANGGDDVFIGGDDFNWVYGGDGGDQLSGNGWEDWLYGDAGDDVLDGGDGADFLYGGAGADTFQGGDGDDFFYASNVDAWGGESYDGGAGFDVAHFETDGTEGFPAVLDLTLYSFTEVESVMVDNPSEVFVGANQLSQFALGGLLSSLRISEAGVADLNGADLSVPLIRIDVGGVTLDMTGAVSDQVVDGSAEGDVVFGGDGADHISGNQGDDLIGGGGGADDLSGGEGDDTLSYATAQAAVVVNLANEIATSAGVEDHVGQFESVVGSAFNDTLAGDDGANVLDGGDGDDLLRGGGGDTLNGGAGSDTVDYSDATGMIAANFAIGTLTIGGAGSADTLISIEGVLAGSGNDSLTGSAAANHLSGGDGDDLLIGAAGSDTLEGGDGEDTVSFADRALSVNLTLSGGAGSAIVGKAETDTLSRVENVTGSSVRDTITGDEADNALLGGGGSDGLVGGDGADHLDGGSGSDTLAGGLGDDSYVVDHVGDKATEGAGAGTDIVFSSETWVLGGNFENLTLTGTGATNGTGNGLNNTIVGNYRANVLTGGNGDDLLQGGDGNDRLDGGSGADTMEGGLGHDTYVVSNTLDTLVENVGEGTDTIESRVAWTLADNFENLTLTGTSNVAGTGNGVANTILGNDGNNTLTGLGGNDRLEGGLGADTLLGGDGADIMRGGSGLDVFTGGAGTDRFLFDEADMAGLTSATADRITDFAGDRIGLTDIDAKTGTADVDDAFSFIGAGAFTGVAGQLRYEQVAGNTLITGDVNGDGIADFMIRLDGLVTLTASHFFL